MNDLNDIALSVSTASNLHEMEQQIETVKNSKLTDEEKNKALKAHKKLVITVFAVVITMILLILVVCVVVCKVFTGMTRIIICLAAIFAALIGLIIFAIFAGPLFSDWDNAYDKVRYGFDGLTEEEIERLKPQANEKKVLRYYYIKNAIYLVLFLLAMGIDIFIVVKFKIPIQSPLFVISLIVITVIWYILEDGCQSEINRIKSGYYKRGNRYICKKCSHELIISFEHIEIYDSYPRDKDGVRLVCCPRCNNIVPLYCWDNHVKDYKKYWERVNK